MSGRSSVTLRSAAPVVGDEPGPCTTRYGWFIEQVRLDPHASTGRYPFTVPVVRHLDRAGGLDLDPRLTFLVGDNGTGKSTLVEALTVAAGFNAEGGSQSFRFATRASESSLGDHLILRWGTRKPRTGYFLRAESFYNMVTARRCTSTLPGRRGRRSPRRHRAAGDPVRGPSP